MEPLASDVPCAPAMEIESKTTRLKRSFIGWFLSAICTALKQFRTMVEKPAGHCTNRETTCSVSTKSNLAMVVGCSRDAAEPLRSFLENVLRPKRYPKRWRTFAACYIESSDIRTG